MAHFIDVLLHVYTARGFDVKTTTGKVTVERPLRDAEEEILISGES